MDISMCENKECRKRKHCLRFSGKPDPLRQAYTRFENDNKDHCYIAIKTEQYAPGKRAKV